MTSAKGLRAMIQSKFPAQGCSPKVPQGSRLLSAHSILVIDAPEARALLDADHKPRSVIFTQQRMLSETMIATVAPDAVVCPLITAEWDIVDLGSQLETLGFRGTLFALTQPLPRAELVVREVRAACRGLAVELLETLCEPLRLRR